MANVPSYCLLGSMNIKIIAFAAKVALQGKTLTNSIVEKVWNKGTSAKTTRLLPLHLVVGSGKRGLLEKGSFQKSPFSRDSREFRDSREPPDCGKPRRIRPFSRDSREFRESRVSRDSSSEKTPFVMTPFSGPEVVGE